jgi:hypothetical protein
MSTTLLVGLVLLVAVIAALAIVVLWPDLRD